MFGCVALLQTLLHMVKMCVCRNKEDENRGGDAKEKGGNFCESLLTLFLFVWIIVGSYYTFRSWGPWVDDGQTWCSSGGDKDICCDAPVMYFSFVVLIVMYGIAALSCFCFCCCVCCVSFLAGVGGANNSA